MTILWHTGDIHFHVLAAGGQGRQASVVAHLRFSNGRMPRLPGILLLATGARRRRVGVQSGAAHQLGRLHQHVRAGLRAHTGCHDRRAVQPGVQGTGDRHRVRARILDRVLRGQVVSDPVESLRPRRHVRIIRRVLRAGHLVRVFPGAGDEAQIPARNPRGAGRQKQPEGRPVAKRAGIPGC